MCECVGNSFLSGALITICVFSLDRVLGIFCVLLKTFLWSQSSYSQQIHIHDSRGSVDRGRSQEVLLQSNCTPDTILKILQSSKTQEIKYKRETITTFRIPSTPFCPKASQNPTDDAALFFLCDNAFPYQVLSIKDDMSLLLLLSRIFSCLPLLCS